MSYGMLIATFILMITKNASETRDGFVVHARGHKDYYGPYGWLTITEAARLFDREFQRYYESNPVKARQLKFRNQNVKATVA